MERQSKFVELKLSRKERVYEAVNLTATLEEKLLTIPEFYQGAVKSILSGPRVYDSGATGIAVDYDREGKHYSVSVEVYSDEKTITNTRVAKYLIVGDEIEFDSELLTRIVREDNHVSNASIDYSEAKPTSMQTIDYKNSQVTVDMATSFINTL